MKSTITGEPSMTGWRHATAFMAVVALLLDAHTGVWAQGSNNRTNTFEQRFPPAQVPTPPAGEQPPTQPPVRQAPTQPPADQVRARPPTTDRARLVSRGRATQEARDGYYGAARRQGETLPIASSGRTTPRAPLVFPRSHSSPRAAISCRHSKVSVTNISPPE